MPTVTDFLDRQRHRLLRVPTAAAESARELGQPESRTRTTVMQISKATLAAIVAWYLAGELIGSEAAWLAPVTAVLMVHSTGYRSVTEGIKRVVAVAVGVAIAATAGNLFGLGALGLLLVVPLSLLGARLRWIGAQGEYIAITAVLLLTFGVSTDENFLISYVYDTLIGAATGALINLFVFPPAYQRSTRAAVSHLATSTAEVLRTVAEGARSGWREHQAEHWHRQAVALEDEARAAQSALAWNREGLRFNPWRPRDRDRPTEAYQPAVDTLWHLTIEVRSLTRSLRDGAPAGGYHRAEGERDHPHDSDQPDSDQPNNNDHPSDAAGSLLETVPALYDNLAPLLEATAEVVDTFGDEPALTGDRLSHPVRQTLERAEELYLDMSQRIPQTTVPGPKLYATAGSTLETVGRMLRLLRELDR